MPNCPAPYQPSARRVQPARCPSVTRAAVYPLVLGSGKKLFSDGFPLVRLALVETRVLASGVVVNT